MGVTVATAIDIDAGPQAVWDVLTDFAAYPEWNPFMDRIDGTAEVGRRLVVHLAGRGGRGTTFRPTVLVATPGEELRWVGRLGPGGLFDGVHSFVLTAQPDGTTRLTHGERFTGILVALFKGATANSRAGFEAFNEALRRRVETIGSRREDASHSLAPSRAPDRTSRLSELLGRHGPPARPAQRTTAPGSQPGDPPSLIPQRRVVRRDVLSSVGAVLPSSVLQGRHLQEGSCMTTTTMTSTTIDRLDGITGAGTPVVSVAPIDLSSPGRPVPLEVRASAPATGTNLPVVVFSHGNGWNLDGYAPLTAFWASRGFVVIQPTHLDSRRNRIGFDHPVFPTIWTERIADLRRILDQLDTIEAAVPGLAGRIDRSRVAATGHSWGGHTAQSLLGARILDEAGQVGEDMSDGRVSAGILFATTGLGGEHLHPFAQANFPFMRPSFQQLTTPTLVVAGDHDQSKMSSRGPDWFTDAYTHSPGATDLLTLHGAEHALGGIVGYEVAETTDEDPQRVAVIQRMSTAYLRTALHVDENSWPAARAAFGDSTDAMGHVDSK